MAAFSSRSSSFLDRLSTGTDEARAREIELFAQQELAADHTGYPEEAIRQIFIGDGRRRGLFDLAGDAYLMKRGTPKPHARAALMALFHILANEKSTVMTNVFRHMPVSDLRKITLWKHLKHGDAEQQMAAFRLLRVLYHTYPPAQFREIINNKQKTLDLFNTFHAKWLREHGGAPAVVEAPIVAERTLPATTAAPATLKSANLAAVPERVQVQLPPAPVVESTIQPVVQPVMQEVRQTVVQPVVQQPEIVQVERAAIVNAPMEKAPVIAETVVAPTLREDSGFVPRDQLPARPIVEATVQPIVQPVMQEVRQTVVQPVVQQPEIVQVERAPIVNAPIEKAAFVKETIINAPVPAESGVVPAGMLPPRPIVESVVQPVLQPVSQEIRQTVVQPILMNPDIVQVTREPLVQATQMAPPIVRETLIAPPIMAGPEHVVAGMQNLQLGTAPIAGTGLQTGSGFNTMSDAPVSGTLGAKERIDTTNTTTLGSTTTRKGA